MGSDKKWYFKIAAIGIVLMVVALTCSVNLTNPTVDTTYITQTFSALGTEMAGNLIAGVTQQPVAAGETQSVEATTGPCASVVHLVTPPEPPNNRESGVHDRDNTSATFTHRANGGENFDQNLYERPYTSGVMDYRPDIDIIDAQLARSGDWVFLTLQMGGQNAAGGMKGVYGIEVDNNGDGRGDFIVYGLNPGAQWSTVGVKAYQDTNKDVGGYTVITADTYPGNGYDTIVFNEGCINDPDAAWARISPANPNMVQLAFKHTLIKNNDKYLWGAFAGLAETMNPAWFDYNDHFTHAIAGSPLSELTNYYPLKAFYGWDNTCRWWIGLKIPKGTEPGLCPYTPEPTPGPTNTKRQVVNSIFWWVP